MRRKLITILISLCMVISMLPVMTGVASAKGYSTATLHNDQEHIILYDNTDTRDIAEEIARSNEYVIRGDYDSTLDDNIFYAANCENVAFVYAYDKTEDKYNYIVLQDGEVLNGWFDTEMNDNHLKEETKEYLLNNYNKVVVIGKTYEWNTVNGSDILTSYDISFSEDIDTYDIEAIAEKEFNGTVESGTIVLCGEYDSYYSYAIYDGTNWDLEHSDMSLSELQSKGTVYITGRKNPTVCEIYSKDGERKEGYPSLAYAFEQVESGETIKMVANCENFERIDLEAESEKTVTLDLNGYVIDCKDNFLFYIGKNYQLSLIDSNSGNQKHHFYKNKSIGNRYYGLWGYNDISSKYDYEVSGGAIVNGENAISVGYGEFHLISGNLIGNKVAVDNGGWDCLYIEGGNIQGNSNAISNYGVMYMTGGEIKNNAASDVAGILNYGTLNLSGGKIINNEAFLERNSYRARMDAQVGGVYNYGEMTIGKDAVITDNIYSYCDENVWTSVANNLVINPYSLITIDDINSKNKMNVGVSLEYDEKGQFTNNGLESDVQFFTSDNPNYCVLFVQGDSTKETTDPLYNDHLELAASSVKVGKNITNGKISVDNCIANAGDTVTVTATPNEGYELETITATYEGTENITVADNKFTMPGDAGVDMPVTVSATFKVKQTPIIYYFPVIDTKEEPKEEEIIEETPELEPGTMSDGVQEILSGLKIRENSKYVRINGKRYIKVYTTVLVGKNKLQELKDAGFTIKYEYYRGTSENNLKKIKLNKNGTFTDKAGKNGSYYFYRAVLKVYDKDEKLVASTTLDQCKYGSRMYNTNSLNMK